MVVFIKPVLRTDVPLRIGALGGLPPSDPSFFSPNPVDLAALGVALEIATLSEQTAGNATRVIAVTIGPKSWEFVLRRALAMGATEVMRVWEDSWSEEMFEPREGSGDIPAFLAHVTAPIVKKLNPQVVLTGDRSTDTGRECFAGFLAASLGWPFAHRAAALVAQGESWNARVRLERGYLREVILPAPAVVSWSSTAVNVPEPSWPVWFASQTAPLPSISPTGSTPPTLHPAQLRPPIPRVKHFTAPDKALDAEGRIAAMVALPPTQEGEVLPATMGVEAQVNRMIEVLKDKGFLNTVPK